MRLKFRNHDRKLEITYGLQVDGQLGFQCFSLATLPSTNVVISSEFDERATGFKVINSVILYQGMMAWN